jgi:cytoskeletal protein RodZ
MANKIEQEMEKRPLILYAVAGILGAAIVVIVILLIVHHHTKPHTTAKKNSTVATQQQKKPSTSSYTPATSATSNSPQTLTNTGPGEVVTLFAGASALGTLAHYSYRRRRA